MGGVAGKLFGSHDLRVTMLGLDAAGKTTMLYKIKLNEVVTTIPTIGFNVETVNFKGVNFTVWDVSTRDRTRSLWRHYFAGTDICFMVVDSSDVERLPEVGEELSRLWYEDALADCVFAILANKQDMQVLTALEVADRLGVHQAPNEVVWAVFGTTATTADGVYEAMEWASEAKTAMKKGRDVPDARLHGAAAASTCSATAQRKGLQVEGLRLTVPELVQVAEPGETRAAATDPIPFDRWAAARRFASLKCGNDQTDGDLVLSLEGPPGCAVPRLNKKEFTHETLLRYLWVKLRGGRAEGTRRGEIVKDIFRGLEVYREATGAIVHVTQVYFWLQLVDVALQTPAPALTAAGGWANVDMAPLASRVALAEDFAHFLLSAPWLLDQQIITRYTPAAADEFRLPDLVQLPSVIDFGAAA